MKSDRKDASIGNDEDNVDIKDKSTEQTIDNSLNSEKLYTFRTKLMFSAGSISRFMRNVQQNQSKTRSNQKLTSSDTVNNRNSDISTTDINNSNSSKRIKEDLILSSLP